MPPAPSQGEGGVDGFAATTGRGIPVRINAVTPQPEPAPLQPGPWLDARRGRHAVHQVLSEGGTRGKGIPIRLN